MIVITVLVLVFVAAALAYVLLRYTKSSIIAIGICIAVLIGLIFWGYETMSPQGGDQQLMRTLTSVVGARSFEQYKTPTNLAGVSQ